jgi:phosphohistidine phosphatase SixA
MPVYLVRHAKAGDRHEYEGRDRDRPLTRAGRAQADALARLLDGEPVSRLLSSPYARCRQTLEPLAARAHLPIEDCDDLAEGAPYEPVLELVLSLPDHAVLCSHGDLIPDVVAAVERRGATIEGAPDWRKGATWVLEHNGDAVTRARALAPPA